MRMSDKIQDENLKMLGQLIENHFSSVDRQFGDIKDKMKEQKEDIKEKLEEQKEDIKELSTKLNQKSDDLIQLKAESQTVGKQWGSFMGIAAGIISSVVISFLIKLLGF